MIFQWFYKHFRDSRVDPGGIEDGLWWNLKRKMLIFHLFYKHFRPRAKRRNNGGTTEEYPAPRLPVEVFLLVFLLFLDSDPKPCAEVAQKHDSFKNQQENHWLLKHTLVFPWWEHDFQGILIL